jgi:hypothetical protein
MDLSIIIVDYNSKIKLLNCLDSIYQADLGRTAFEIIVVNNNSEDDLSDLAGRYASLRVIVSPKNLGMGGGNNLGSQTAAGEYILILNPDTLVRGRAITVLLEYLRAHPRVGLVGPKLLYPDGSLQFSCSRFPHFFMPLLRRTFLGDYFKKSRDSFTMNDFDHQSVRPVDWLMGSCLMFKKEIRLASGEVFRPAFDPRYFMYFEDTDLARQIWSRGLRVVYNPEAVIIHDHQRQSARHPWYIAVFRDRITWIHISSWFKYFIKWGINNEQKYEED